MLKNIFSVDPHTIDVTFYEKNRCREPENIKGKDVKLCASYYAL